MRLLLDQNISFRVSKNLSKVFPGICHVKQEGLENASDMEIWQYARKNDLAIVTFDADFSDISLIKGIPPKIIWLRTGNMNTKEITECLRSHQFVISMFLNNKEYKDIDCLEIY